MYLLPYTEKDAYLLAAWCKDIHSFTLIVSVCNEEGVGVHKYEHVCKLCVKV